MPSLSDLPDPRNWLRAPGEPPAAEPTVSETVRALIAHLASIPRAPGSPGEAEAAEHLAEQLRNAGATVQVESAVFHDGYARPIGTLTGVAAVAGLLASLRPRGLNRRLATLLGAATAALIADDCSNALRVYRNLFTPLATQNVVAVLGDPDAPRTLVILAHHDAAPTGRIFDQTGQRVLGGLFPGLIERMDTGLPLWHLVIAGPALIAYGAARGKPGLIRAGTVLAAGSTAAFADVLASPTVPGANDNLSALGVQLGLAERLREEPIDGLRVLLVSCGAEEVVQGGIYSFAKRYFPQLPRDSTWFLNLDTVGSPYLALLEGEGPVVMEDYHHRPWRDLIARVADRAGAPVYRGLRARNSTDAVIPSRAAFPTATFTSVDRVKALGNYHLPTDTPENLVWSTIAQTMLVCEAVARELAVNPWI